MWRFRGQQRPDFADAPGPGQESVWDYPRPPAIEIVEARVEVMHDVLPLARTDRVIRVLETASPPTVYLPPDSVNHVALEQPAQSSFCEWKGSARYWSLAAEPTRPPVGWSYPAPSDRFADLAGWYSFYPARVACFLDGERVRPQGGGFYGGWVTNAIVGPWKGEAGTGGW